MPRQLDQFSFNAGLFQHIEHFSDYDRRVPVFSGAAVDSDNFH
jgi:hypothetical protein